MRKPPLSAVLSASGRRLGGGRLGGASSDFGTPSLTGAATQLAASSNCLRSPGLHPSCTLPCWSYFDPRVSKPWVSSCAADTPIPPKLTAGSAALSKNGG